MHAFPVKIGRDETVGELKDAIKAKKAPEFDHFAADKLKLWKVDVPADHDEELTNLTLQDHDVLLVTQDVEEYWPEKPPKKHIHIIVEPPDATDRPTKKQKLEREEYSNILEVALHLRKIMSDEQREELKFIEHPSKKRLGVIKKHVLYVRESYRDLYRIITNMINRVNRVNIVTDDDFDHRFLIAGTSGVGKSCFLIYLLIQLLCNETDATVIFQPKGGNLFYRFEDSNLFIEEFKEVFTKLGNSKTWYLVDGRVPEEVGARTVVSASSKCYNEREFQEFIKAPIDEFCMPPWSIEELDICRSNVYPEVPQDLMFDLSDVAGGVPRYVLEKPASHIYRHPHDEWDVIMNVSLKRIKSALSQVTDFNKLVECFSENGQYVEFSSRIVHRWPDTSYHESQLSWASSYVFEEIIKKVEDEKWKDIYRKVQNPCDTTNSRGIYFEIYVHHLFMFGGQTFESRRLQERENGQTIYSKLTIPTKPTMKYIRRADQLSGYNEEDMFIRPTIRNFGAVDLILTPNCIFQVTVSQKHPVKQSELVKVVQNMPAYRNNRNAKIFLYFVVPDDIYDIFEHQSYVTPQKKIGNNLEAFQPVKRRSNILSNVEQWVVKIKTTPEVTVTSIQK